MLAASMLIFGSIGIFRRNIALSSGMIAFVRGLLGTVFLCAAARVKGVPLRGGTDRKTYILLAVSGGLIGLNWMLLFEAFTYTTVPIATLCYYMQPTIVILLSPLLFRERLTGRRLAAAAAALAGMILISGVFGTGTEGTAGGKGILFGLSAAVLYAIVVIMNKKLGGVPAYEKTVIQLAFAAAVMIPYLFLTGNMEFTGISGKTLVLLLIMGVVHTGLAYVLYFGSIEGVKAQTIAVFSYIDPVSALIFSALFLHETLTIQGIAGAVLILGAAAVSESA